MKARMLRHNAISLDAFSKFTVAKKNRIREEIKSRLNSGNTF
jgi:hypothetical protein